MSSSLSILEPESIYIKTLEYSGLLLTIALLFYHMTKFQSLEMAPVVSGVFAVIIILISVVYLFTGTYSYFIRLRNRIEKNTDEYQDSLDFEKNNMILYFIMGMILLVVQCAIAFFIIKGIYK
jgi:hypothetical protein